MVNQNERFLVELRERVDQMPDETRSPEDNESAWWSVFGMGLIGLAGLTIGLATLASWLFKK